MCLRNKIDKQELQAFKNKISKEGLVVYKIAGIGRCDFFPLHMNTQKPYKVGTGEADTSHTIEMYMADDSYKSGFHFYVNREDAECELKHIRNLLKNSSEFCRKRAREQRQCLRRNYEIIECIVKKSWITNMGKDGCRYSKTFDTVVAKKAIFPKFSWKKINLNKEKV